MKRRAAGIISALVFAAAGTIALVAFVRGAEERAVAGEELVSVLVVKNPISAGTSADAIAAAVKSERIPKKVVADGAVADLVSLKGLVASVDLLAGEQLTASRWIPPEAYSPAHGSVAVPPGLLEMSVALDAARTVGGVVRPGDTVAYVASFPTTESGAVTHLILHKVLVTNVQGAPVLTPTQPEDAAAPRAASPTGDLLVTLAADATSVERMVYAAEYGTVWLALEPADASDAPTPVQTQDSVLGAIA